MKRFLFLGILFSIPVWTMEVVTPSNEPKAPQQTTELYCQINENKHRAFRQLRELLQADEINKYKKFKQGVMALQELDKYANERKQETSSSVSWSWQTQEDILPDIWISYSLIMKEQLQYLPFETNKIKGILEKMPYITKVMTRPEFRALAIEYNNNVLNGSNS